MICLPLLELKGVPHHFLLEKRLLPSNVCNFTDRNMSRSHRLHNVPADFGSDEIVLSVNCFGTKAGLGPVREADAESSSHLAVLAWAKVLISSRFQMKAFQL